MVSFETVHVAKELIELIHSPKTHVRQLSAVLTKDPVLMKSVLRYANSSVYGFRNRISDLNLAIILLGFDVLKKTIARVIINNSVRKIVTTFSEYDAFWHHALQVATLCRALSMETKRCDPSDAFTAGLLHDIGHIAPNLDIPIIDLPVHVEGMDNAEAHAIVGAKLAQQWEVPAYIVEAIHYHHSPVHASTGGELAALVHIADVVCTRWCTPPHGEPNELPYEVQSGTLLGLSVESAEEVLQVLQVEHVFHQLQKVDFMTELKATILNALSFLPEDERVVLALRYYDGLTFAEIGKLCGYDASVAEQLHTRAFYRLKTYFLPNVKLNNTDDKYDDSRRDT